MSSKPNSKNESPPRFSTPNKAKGLISPRGPHDPRNSESSMNSVNNFTTPRASKPRSFEEISADPGFKKQREQLKKSVRVLRIPNSKARRQLFSVPEDESGLRISGPASKISVSNIAKQAKTEDRANVKSESRASTRSKQEDSRRQIENGIRGYREARRKASTRSKQEDSRRQIENGIRGYREAMLEANTGPKAGQIKAIERQAKANAESEARTKAAAKAKAYARVEPEQESSVPPVPPNIFRLFNNLDARSDNLSQNDQRKLQRAHSMANSVMSYPNTNPTKLETLYNVQNNLQQLQSKLNNKVKASTEQLVVISKLEKQLEREKEKHARATALIKEFKIDVPVPITKTILNTRKINELTKEMEQLKKDGDLNRSRLLGQIVSLAKKEKVAMAALSNMKNMTVAKNKNITEMKRKLEEYATAVETLEARIKELLKNTKSAQTQTKFTKQVTAPLKVITAVKPKTSTAVKTITDKNIRAIIKQETNAKVRTTPPGITKTNIERLLQPFKQPVTVTVAPTISVKGGSLQQTQIQYKTKPKTPANKKKKPLKLVRSPETMRREKSAAFRKEILSRLRSPVAAKRREALYNLRTPTTGQRKKHVIELIDRVLRRMKVRKDVENKLIKFYESLSERHIKQLFGGRTREEVRSIIKKQVAYFSKKR